MTSMSCFTNASECALSRNNGMSPDIAGGLREASCNVAKCADQEILSCVPNFGFFDNSLTTCVLCCYPPANSLVTWCVSEMAAP